MIHGSMDMGTAGIVCIVSMLIVFGVLLILYAATMIMGKTLKQGLKPAAAKSAPKAAAPKAAPAAPAAPKEDEDELMAVLAAAIAAYQGSANPMVRNSEDL